MTHPNRLSGRLQQVGILLGFFLFTGIRSCKGFGVVLVLWSKLDYINDMPRPKKDPKLRMGTDLRIPVTNEQKKLIVEATSDEPGGMAAWARAVLLKAARKKKESTMLGGFDKTLLAVTYNEINQSSVSRVSGSRVFDRIRAIFPDIAPPTSPARLSRLVSQGLLAKDKANSSSRTKVYAPTDAGRKMWEELKAELMLGGQ